MSNNNKYEDLINSKDFQQNRLKYTSLQPYYSFLIKKNLSSLREVSVDGLINLIGFFKYYNSDFFNMKNISVNCQNAINFEINFNLSGDYKLDVNISVPSMKEGLIYCLQELSRLSALYEIKKEDFENLFFNEFEDLNSQKELTIKEKMKEVKKQYLEFKDDTVKYINRNASCKLNSYKKIRIKHFEEIYTKILKIDDL
jgi:hypothetical protein